MLTVQGGLFEAFDLLGYRVSSLGNHSVRTRLRNGECVVLRYRILSGERPEVFVFRARVLFCAHTYPGYSYKTYVVTKDLGSYSYYAKYLAVCLFFI